MNSLEFRLCLGVGKNFVVMKRRDSDLVVLKVYVWDSGIFK